jgi:hypothetical protein
MPSSVGDTMGLRGDLEHVGLGSLFAFLESERRTGALQLRRGADVVTLYLRAGALSSVENLGRFHHAHDRVFELLSWRGGTFEFTPSDGGNSEPSKGETSLSYLLMEHARREDEEQK